MKTAIKQLLQGNKEWTDEVNATHPEFFSELAKGQKPEYLWIGCSDSRVPATQLSNLMPGSIFVHRNIANMVVHTDSNLLSVVYYAVKVLKVKYIIVCGHYGCGGVKAAMSNDHFGLLLDSWIAHIKDVYRLNESELNDIKDENKRFDKFVELNIKEQVNNLAKLSFIQEEWENGTFPHIHGMVYSIEDGKLIDLDYSMNTNSSLPDIFKYQQI